MSLPRGGYGLAYASVLVPAGTTSTDGMTAVVVTELPPDTAYYSVAPVNGAGEGTSALTGTAPILIASPTPVPAGSGSFGFSVAWLGDIDGDDKSDYIVGDHVADPGGVVDAGSAYVFSGGTGTLLYQKDGTTFMEYLGQVVGGPGDVSGDGVPDFIVCVPFTGSTSTGTIHVYSGADGTLLYQKLGSDEPNTTHLGESVSTAGDVDGDGCMDFIAGAPGSAPDGVPPSGSVFVFSGKTGALIYRRNGASSLSGGGGEYGHSVSGGNDIDGDGISDFIVGAPYEGIGGQLGVGAVYVYSGATGSLVYKVTGDPIYSFELGTGVSVGGDIDGDGRADFIAGAHNGTWGALQTVGVVRAYSGADSRVLFQRVGYILDDVLGNAVCTAGDVDGDGYCDVVAGRLVTDGGNGGRFQVYSGADGSLLYEIPGQSLPNSMGTSVSPAGDVNGDGRSDFLAGIPNTVFTTSGELGIIPSEAVNPLALDGFGVLHMPNLLPAGAKAFTGSGGTAPYTWSLLTNNSGAVLDAAGNYTAGSATEVYDTIRITDAVGRSHDTRILVTSGVPSPSQPRRPTALKAILVAPTQVDLTWADNATDETSYILETRIPTNPWATSQVFPANTASYSMTGLDPDKVYFFRIKARNAIADSQWSPVAITTLQTPTGVMTTPVSSTEIDVSWTDTSVAETGFEIQYRNENPGSSWLPGGTADADATSMKVTGLTPGSTFYFRVRAITSVVRSSWSSETLGSTP